VDAGETAESLLAEAKTYRRGQLMQS